MAKKKPEALLTFPVTYGDVSFGDETARLGVTVERKYLALGKADAHLTNKRLISRITAVPGSDNPDQQQLITDEAEVRAAIDVKGFRVSRKFITFGMTFALASVDKLTLCDFSRRSGQFHIEELSEIPKPEPKVAATVGADDGGGDGEAEAE